MSDRTLTSRSGQTLTVRRLVERDVTALQAFHENLSHRSRGYFTPHAYDAETIGSYAVRNTLGKDLIYVLENDGREIIGYFFLWEFEKPVPVLGIGLADEWQDQGLGGQLMCLLVDAARDAGRSGLELTTIPTNARAHALYEKCGFRDVGLVSNIAGDGLPIIEQKMFLPLKAGAGPTEREFKPPA